MGDATACALGAALAARGARGNARGLRSLSVVPDGERDDDEPPGAGLAGAVGLAAGVRVAGPWLRSVCFVLSDADDAREVEAGRAAALRDAADAWLAAGRDVVPPAPATRWQPGGGRGPQQAAAAAGWSSAVLLPLAGQRQRARKPLALSFNR